MYTAVHTPVLQRSGETYESVSECVSRSATSIASSIDTDELMPIEYASDDQVLLAPEMMEPRIPYPFKFLDQYLVVVKNDDDELLVFYLPEAP